jgi:hypothetical protein
LRAPRLRYPSRTARVAQLLAATAAELPAADAAESGLAARVINDLAGPARLLDVSEPAAHLARKLASSGRIGKALDVLEALLRIDIRRVETGSELLPDRTIGRYRQDEYLVERSVRPMLDELVVGDARRTIRLLTRLLASAQQQLAREDSTRWRDDVLGRHPPYGDDPRHLLLELLRDASAGLGARDSEQRRWLLEQLERQQSAVFKRLRLHLLAELPDEQARRRAAVLDPDTIFARDAISEVFRLLPAAYAEMDTADRRAVLTLILRGPPPERYGLTPEQLANLAEEIERSDDEWRQRWLSALEPLLDDSRRASLDALRAHRGRLERPGFGGVRSTSWTGPTSPVSVGSLAEMDPDAVISLLRDFRAEAHFAVPTPEGLGREFAQAVQRDPRRWLWVAGRLSELPPLYVRSWLTGLHSAVRAESQVAGADQLLDTLAWVLEQPANADAQGEPLQDDVDFYGAQRAAADLLIELLAHDQLGLEARVRVWKLVSRLASDRDPSPAREADAAADSLTLAFAALRARGAVAVLRYLQWLDGRLPAKERPRRWFEVAHETHLVLERLVEQDPSRAVRAALAAELPVLAAVDAAWLGVRFAEFADPDGDELARVGWHVYLNYAALYGSVTKIAADAYRRAVGALAGADPEVNDDRRHLAEHVAVIWRDLPDTVPGLLDQFLTVAPDADRARVVAMLGRALHPDGPGDYVPTDSDLERHRTMWDARLRDAPGPLELSEFGWWWSSGVLRDPLDLRRLTDTLRLAEGRVGDIRDAVVLASDAVVADAALAEPAIEMLEVLAEYATARAQYIDVAPLTAILRAGLAVDELRERAAALVHRFGEQGYLTLRSLLDSARP